MMQSGIKIIKMKLRMFKNAYRLRKHIPDEICGWGNDSKNLSGGGGTGVELNNFLLCNYIEKFMSLPAPST